MPYILFKLAVDAFRIDLSEIKRKVHNPKWNQVCKVHDWRNYIDDGIKQIWEYLSIDAKLIAMIMAEKQAKEEDWD